MGKRSKNFAKTFSLLACFSFGFLAAIPAKAGGLFGDIFQAVGNATGITPLRDLGRNMDREHDQFKNHNPDYKRLEEEATRLARLPQTLACVAAFEAIVQPVKSNCNRFVSQSALETRQQQYLIDLAKTQLISSGLLTTGDFDGVSISWCQGNFLGAGITPNRNEILLNRSLIEYPWSVAATLGHEMKHVEQYRRMGTDNFKCDYAVKFAQCGGCQDNRHALEHEAYAFEEAVARGLVASNYQNTGIDVYPNMQLVQYQTDTEYVDEITGETVLFTGTNTRAHRFARESCVGARQLGKVSSGECTSGLEFLFAAVEKALSDHANDGNLPSGEAMRAEMVEEITEYCTPPDMRFGSSDGSDAYGRDASYSPFIISQDRVDACVNHAMTYFTGNALLG